MGISGLLTALKPLIHPSNISKFKNKSIAVDTYRYVYIHNYYVFLTLTPAGCIRHVMAMPNQ